MTDLSDAYIVRVSPMNFEQPVELIARNLHDFLCMLCFHPQLLDWDAEQSPLHEQVSTALQLKPIETSCTYLARLQQIRMQSITMATLDGIGVAHHLEHEKEAMSLFNFENKDTLTLNEVIKFFHQATYPAKLGFLRDAQSKGLIWDNDAVKQFIKEQLIHLGLHAEAERIEYPAY